MNQAQALYRIGAVSSLTGLPPNTIRTWERRYEVVTPERSGGGGRRYSDADVERLQLLRTLSGFGEAIGAIASLDNERLRERIGKHAQATAVSTPVEGQLRLGILHEQLRAQVRELGLADVHWHIGRHAGTYAEFIAQDAVVDVLVLDLAELGERPEARLESLLEQTEARLAVVVYDFARRATLATLADAGARLVRGPLLIDALERMIRDHLGIVRTVPPTVEQTSTLSMTGDAPARRYTDAKLGRFREMRSSVQCECPNHLAALITSLNAFETYSRRCISRSAEDAALHARLAEGTAMARARMEDLLNSVLVHDGVQL